MKSVIKGLGNKCFKCNNIMERRTHQETPKFKPYRKLYYSEWDFCKKCRFLKHYEIFKVYFDEY